MESRSHRNLWKEAGRRLRAEDFEERLPEWGELPLRKVISPLLSYLFSTDPLVKWRAVRATGFVAARMADEQMELARNVMRRLIWSLNDESGGIGWGAAEAMGEIMARHERLAEEYVRILESYIREDGNRLENGPLERGVLWGLGRLARVRPQLLVGTGAHLFAYLESNDPYHRGLALWALRALGGWEGERGRVLALLKDETEIELFEEGRLERVRVGELAERLLRSQIRGEG